MVIIVVSAVTVAVDLAIAVFIGVIISALVFAWETRKENREAKKDKDATGNTMYTLKGALFFGSVQSFKDIFSMNDDSENVVIDFIDARVYDYSGVEAIQNIAERYGKQNKKLHLLNLSEEWAALIGRLRSYRRH